MKAEGIENDVAECLDEAQIKALMDIEKATGRSVGSQIREAIDLYLKAKKGERDGSCTFFSPIVFDRPYW